MTRYQPRLIVLHVGGNVIHAGRTPAQVLGDWVHPDLERYLVRVRLTQRLLGPPDRAK